MIATRFAVDIGIAVTAGAIAAVIRRAGGEPEPVLVDGWPAQSVDAHNEDALSIALKRVHTAIWQDVDSVVVTHPTSFGLERIRRLRQVAQEAGWGEVRMVSAPGAVGIAHGSIDPAAPTTVVVDTTAERCEASVLVPQPNAAWGVVGSQIRSPQGHSVVETVRTAATAADVISADIERAVVIGLPPAVHDATASLEQAGVRGAIAMSPFTLAGDGLVADGVVRGGRHSSASAVPVRGTWPRPVSSLACLVGSVAALAAVMSGAGTVGAQPDAVTFALAGLGLFTAMMGAATFTASRFVAGPAGWRRAGRTLMVGAGLGVAAVVAAIVVVAAHFAVSAWPLVLAGGLAVAPSALACVVIGAEIATRPDVAPRRNLWPPVGAMAAVAVAAAFVRSSTMEGVVASGWDLLPTRVGVGVWLFAVTGLVIAAPWPRVMAGLAVGAAAGMVAGPGTVEVFAVVAIAVVAGWWLIKASLVHFDRHGLPEVTPSSWTQQASSRTRTVQQP